MLIDPAITDTRELLPGIKIERYVYRNNSNSQSQTGIFFVTMSEYVGYGLHLEVGISYLVKVLAGSGKYFYFKDDKLIKVDLRPDNKFRIPTNTVNKIETSEKCLILKVCQYVRFN